MLIGSGGAVKEGDIMSKREKAAEEGLGILLEGNQERGRRLHIEGGRGTLESCGRNQEE